MRQLKITIKILVGQLRKNFGSRGNTFTVHKNTKKNRSHSRCILNKSHFVLRRIL